MDWKRVNYILGGLLFLMIGVIGYLLLAEKNIKGEAPPAAGIKIEAVSEIEGVSIKADEEAMRLALDKLGLWPLKDKEANILREEMVRRELVNEELEKVVIRVREESKLNKDIEEEGYRRRMGGGIGGEEVLVSFMRPLSRGEGKELEMLVYINRKHFIEQLEGKKRDRSVSLVILENFVRSFYEKQTEVGYKEILEGKIGNRHQPVVEVREKAGLLRKLIKPAYGYWVCEGDGLCEAVVAIWECEGGPKDGVSCTYDGFCNLNPFTNYQCVYQGQGCGKAYSKRLDCEWIGNNCTFDCEAEFSYASNSNPDCRLDGDCNTYCVEEPKTCGDCSVECGGGTKDCTDTCDTWPEACNTQPCCEPTYPGAPSLSSPDDGASLEETTVSLSWQEPADWGVGCPENDNQYNIYVEQGDSSPDVLVDTVDSTVGSYDFSGAANREYYWRVEADNGSLATSSETWSFNTAGEIYGTFFDASEVENCADVAGQPKLGGVTVTATGQTGGYGPYSQDTAGDGSYSLDTLRQPEDYLMSFSGLDTARYDETPKLMCDFGVADNPSTWQTSLNGGGNAVQWRVGFWQIYGTWFQVQGGEVYAQNGIESIIPGTCSSAGNWESCGNVVDSGGSYTDQTPLVRKVYNTDGSRDYAGVAFIGSGEINVGEADNAVVSHTGWQATSEYQGRSADYGYFNVVTGRVDREEWGGSGKPSGSDSGIYTSTDGPGGATTIDSDWDLGGGGSDETVVIVHDGDVSITSNMNVEKGSYLAVISSGDIGIADNVTSLEGVYIADNTISVESTGDTSTDEQFIGEGTFVGWGGVSLNRDRGITNNSEPPHRFIFRQDFVVNAPDGMRSSRVTWREIRP